MNIEGIDDMLLKWNEFETLMEAALGGSFPVESREKRTQYSFVKNVIQKRKALEKQQTCFTQASEETILQEYRKLRKAHREFISTFEEARKACTSRSLKD